MSWKPAAVCAGLAAALGISKAEGHVIAPQYSMFDNGALHLVVTPHMLVPLLGLGFALGQIGRKAAAGAGALWLAAFAVSSLAAPPLDAQKLALLVPLTFLLAGAALISPRWCAPAAAAALGFCTAQLALSEAATSGLSPWFTLGLGTGAGLVLFFAAEGTVRSWRDWFKLPARIIASWLMAAGIMFFGLALKPFFAG